MTVSRRTHSIRRCEPPHGPHCPTPWGYDPEHTDSDRPYTVQELAVRPNGPHRYAYPDTDQYVRGWALWRALRRDRQLNPAERQVVGQLKVDRVVAAMSPGARRDLAEALGTPAVLQWRTEVLDYLAQRLGVPPEALDSAAPGSAHFGWHQP
jgi:hypothetical protein